MDPYMSQRLPALLLLLTLRLRYCGLPALLRDIADPTAAARRGNVACSPAGSVGEVWGKCGGSVGEVTPLCHPTPQTPLI